MGSYSGLNHWRYCDGAGPQRLLVHDLDGKIRWVYQDLPASVNMGLQFDYFGGGLFAWGGGESMDAQTRLLDVSGVELYATRFPGSTNLVFHHDGRRLDDGRILTLAMSSNGDGAGHHWTGFAVQIHTPGKGVDWEFDSQTAVDLGMLPTGTGDVYHANWTNYQVMPDGSERVYVSMCYQYAVLVIDVATGLPLYKVGSGGDFDLFSTDGDPLPDSEFSQCQHGLEVEGDHFLYYDNGWDRGTSRAMEIEIDEATWTATQLWTWTDNVWWEYALGDADFLPDGHVQVTQAHTECWGGWYGDKTAVVEFDSATGAQVWRFEYPNVNDDSYRSERMEACDVFPVTKWCPDAAVRLSELDAVFGGCDAGDADGDGISGCDGDCGDGDLAVHPGAAETCDGRDQDCDDRVDDDPSCYGCTDSGTHLACTASATWPEARAICQAFGADLAVMTDPAVNLAASALIEGPAWIGATDFGLEGSWTDPTGASIPFAAWYRGEPNDWYGEDCAATNFGADAQWADYACTVRQPFLCAW